MSSNRLSTFGQRLQSLSDSFYSTILQDSKEDNKLQIKNAQQLEHLSKSTYKNNTNDDFTFDQCSISHLTSNDDFSFTFHSVEQPTTKVQNKSFRRKHQSSRIQHSSTPYSTHADHSIRKCEDETIVVEETHRRSSSSLTQPIIIGYYPVVTYQPVCVPPPMYLSKEQIQSQLNDCSTLTKVTPMKKV
ncbi:hypothetical protein I4U23_015879 [Adineta vaga]|nr:hypothetical protein I4U23_015879 [Adineta vaga]